MHLTCKCTEYQCSSNSGCYVITGALVQKAAITGALVQKAAITGALVQKATITGALYSELLSLVL